MENLSTYICSERVHLTRLEGLLSCKAAPQIHSRNFRTREFNPISDLSRCQVPRSWKEVFFRHLIRRDTHSLNKVSTGTCIGSGPVNARNAGRDGPQYPLTIGLSFRIPFKVVSHIAGSRRRVGMRFRHSNESTTCGQTDRKTQ